MHLFDECRALMGTAEPGIAGFAAFFHRMAEAQGDAASVEPAADGSVVIRQRGWRLMRGLGPLHEAAFDCWNELLAGCLAAHDRHLRWSVTAREDWGDAAFAWRVARKG